MPLVYLITGLIFAFLFGITVGSFLNVCIYRLPNDQSLMHPPSHCPACNHRLGVADLMPLLSYLALRGRCRYCGVRISPRYFVIELITGLLFVGGWYALSVRYGISIWRPEVAALAGLWWVWASAMLVTFMIDLDTTYVIEPVTWVAMLAGILYEVIEKWYNPWFGAPFASKIFGVTIPWLPNAVPGMVLGFLVFIAMDGFGRLVFRKPGMGLGDAFIGAAIGAMLGPKLAAVSFGMAVVLGAVIGMILIVLGNIRRTPAPGAEEEKAVAKRDQQASKSEGPLQEEEEDELPEGRYMPFGPFLTACAVAVAFAPTWFNWAVDAGIVWWLYKNPLLSGQ
jgi:leader peptidase (prepilin peptidase)/N-methyltransferase